MSCIVPSCSHVDITEHEVHVIVTEYGVADLRSKEPKERTAEMIRVAHPDYRPMLEDYYRRAVEACSPSNCHTPPTSWKRRPAGISGCGIPAR